MANPRYGKRLVLTKLTKSKRNKHEILAKFSEIFTKNEGENEMKEASFEMHIDPNRPLIRGQRAKTNVFDDCADENVLDMLAQIEPLKYPKDASREHLGFDPNMIIIKSHREGDVTVINECKFTSINLVEENNGNRE